MAVLPPRPDLNQLRRMAKDRLKAARAGDRAAIEWLAGDTERDTVDLRLSTAQLRLARDYGFPSWPRMHLEIARRNVLDLRDADRSKRFSPTTPIWPKPTCRIGGITRSAHRRSATSPWPATTPQVESGAT